MAEKKSVGYDKVLLGVGALVAVGLGALVMVKAGGLEGEFETSSGQEQDAPPLAGKALIETSIASLGETPVIDQGKTPKGRGVDLFTGIPLYVSKDGGDPIDLLEEGGTEIHEGIPNKWWHDYGIDPGFADSPERDEDVDGFSNREEYDGGTDPTDDTDFPSLIDKLELVKLEKRPYAITYSSDAADSYQFRYEDRYTGSTRLERTDYIPAGDPQRSVFFTEGPATLRFRLLEVVDREIKSERTGVTSTVKIAIIEDLHPNKQGEKFEVPRGSRSRVIRTDYTAILMLNAAGGEGIEFKVEENNSFALPFDENAAEKPYTFAGVNEAGEVVIKIEGSDEPHVLPVPE